MLRVAPPQASKTQQVPRVRASCALGALGRRPNLTSFLLETVVLQEADVKPGLTGKEIYQINAYACGKEPEGRREGRKEEEPEER